MRSIKFYTLFLSTAIVYGDVSGTVYHELPMNGSSINQYGVQESNEAGIANITVTAYPSGLTTATDQNGEWHLATSGSVRVEFTNLPVYLKESLNSQSSVQFLNDGETADLGLYNPTHYTTTDNTALATTHFVNGQEDPDSGALPTLFGWPYTNRGGVNANQLTLADTSIARSIWGLAYSSTRKQLYAATFLRRHASIGSNGLGTLYVTDLENNTTNYWMDIPNTGTIGDDLSRGLGAEDKPNTDAEAFAKVAKVGLGDIEISEDESTLYVMNLFDKKIYEVEIDTQTVSKSYTAPTAVCSEGVSRPFALTEHEGFLYVGSVCDASTSGCDTNTPGNCPQLTAHVNKVAVGDTTGTDILALRLDYDKPQALLDLAYTDKRKNWNPWTDNYADVTDPANNKRLIHPVPLLTNIKFDADNNMILAFSDRTAMQGGNMSNNISGILNENWTFSAGDILKAMIQNDGNYTVANPTLIDDKTVLINRHGEGSLGAAAHLMGSNELLFTHYDNLRLSGEVDTSVFYTKGVTFTNLTSGVQEGGYRVADNNRPIYFGKSTGVGDLELIHTPAPIEIGNRIWKDVNKDGIQNANEPALSGLIVKLFKDGIEIAAATTDSQGTYLFSNAIKSSTASRRYQINELEANHSYQIIIPNISGSSQQSVLSGLTLTTSASTAAEASPLNDSDAVQIDTNATVTINPSDIPTAGANNYSFDIGFKTTFVPTDPTLYALGDYVWIDTNQNGIQDAGEVGLNGIHIDLYSSADCSGSVMASTTTATGGTPSQEGFYQFTNLPAGNYCLDFTNIPTDYRISPDTGADDTTNSDANSSGQIGSINLTADNPNLDLGLYPTPIIPVPNTYTLGDYAWEDTNQDGIQDANESGINGITVSLYTTADCSGEMNATTLTLNGGTPAKNGFYQFNNLPTGTYCVAFTLPNGYHVSPQNSTGDTTDSDADTNGLISSINLDQNNSSFDIGLYQLNSDTNTTPDDNSSESNTTDGDNNDTTNGEDNQTEDSCSVIQLYDDNSNAGEIGAGTVIDVIANDTLGDATNYSIKLLAIDEGEALWSSGATLPDTITLQDSLTVEGEGVWEVVDNQVQFMADQSFNGIPSSIYYVIIYDDCHGQRNYSNVAKVTINTACCHSCDYKSSVPSLNILSMISLMLLTSYTLLFYRRELNF